MYVGVDIGGTKTLVAVFTADGKIVEEVKFPTPKKYDNWLLELRNVAAHLKHQEFRAAGVAAPGAIDRKHGRVIRCGNLPWKNVPLQADVERIFDCPVAPENDANMAALSESMLHKDSAKLLYITISTGIGTGFTVNQHFEAGTIDIEGGHMVLDHKGKLTKWEEFASGKAIFERYGKRASDIPANDTTTWTKIARDLSVGVLAVVAITQPDLIVIGGSVGEYFERYHKLLKQELDKHDVPMAPIPPIVEAKRPNECVIFGCFELAKQLYGHENAA